MTKYYTALMFLALLSASLLKSQTSMNMGLWDVWDDPSLLTYSDGFRYNDLWGYAAPDGREYAILGSLQKVHFVEVTTPANPVEVDVLTPGSTSLWRDFKTYGQYAYGVADQGLEGLLVMDLSGLPGSVSLTNQLTGQFQRAHNIFIDVPNGRLYVVGSNTVGQGLIVYDVATDPANPIPLANPILSSFGGPFNSYVHDVYVQDNIAYCSHGYAGFYYYDVSDPASPVMIDGINTSGYNHSSWLIGNQYIVYAEEVPQGIPLSIRDLNNSLTPVASIKEPLLAPAHLNNTPHNPFVKGNILYVSYYEDGVQVFSVSNPANPTRIAYYDTEPNNTTYNGTTRNWGVYPFLPSGVILASDTNNGLFVLQLQAGAFPVEWLSFQAEAEEKGITLDWETAQEENNERFVIERSADGQCFQAIGEVKGSGTTYVPTAYGFEDNRPVDGLNYYRIKQQDFDGNTAFSEVRAVEWRSCEEVASVVVVAAGGELRLPEQWHQQDGEALFCRADGQQLHRLRWSVGDSTLPLAGGYAPGFYVLQHVAECGVQICKVVIY